MALRRWSTADVEPSQALDYYAAAIRQALVPMSVECRARANFHASVEAARFGPLEVLRMFGSSHRVIRGAAELGRSDRRLYHLVVNRLAPWRLVQLGRVELRPGDAILTDSALPHELSVGTYELINVTMPAEFVERWVPDPALLTARRLDRDGHWSAPLAAFAAQMTPEFATGLCPLPDEVVTQQLGALLMLAAGALAPDGRRAAASEAGLHDRVAGQLRERLADARLTAARVAASLDLPESAVHHALAAHGETFAALLLRLRLARVERLRATPAGSASSPDELARSAGFRDGASLSAALRNRAGPP